MCSTQAAEALSFGNGESPSSPKMAKDDSHGALEKVGSEQACLPSLELLVVHLKRKTGQSELSPARTSKASVPKYAFMAMAKKDKNKKIHLAFSVAIEIISRTTLPEQWPYTFVRGNDTPWAMADLEPVLPDHFVHKIL